MSESETEAEEPANREAQSRTWSLIYSSRLLQAIPTMQFSLDRNRRSHKQNHCSASDSVGLIFTRSYRYTLLITTPTTTPSLVKPALSFIVTSLMLQEFTFPPSQDPSRPENVSSQWS